MNRKLPYFLLATTLFSSCKGPDENKIRDAYTSGYAHAILRVTSPKEIILDGKAKVILYNNQGEAFRLVIDPKSPQIISYQRDLDLEKNDVQSSNLETIAKGSN